ncbi:MAG: Alpha-N-arabinofuranosidase, partial [Verrucomicrobiales bacterium]|nr:Alpha-N-arabinofuranosidase [Verrucomicrobiales bacterium]
MSNPWTISGPRVLLSTPHLSWESWIQEGPEILKRNGKVFLVYAANKSWTDSECLGMLVNSDGNYLSPTSWTKMSQPVFKTYTSTNGSVNGPGHCSFSQSLDGTEDWIFYHGAKTSGSGWDRDIRMQKFTWNANGYPN